MSTWSSSRARLLPAALLLLAASCAPAGGAGTGGGRPLSVRYDAGPSPGPGIYAGAALCRRCHPRIYAFWESTPHAAAMRSFKTGSVLRPECLRCHTTGYGTATGYRGREETPALASVGCEACHGPGEDHARSRYPEAVPVSLDPDCPPCETNRVCRSCHTPRWSPDFSLQEALGAVSCRLADAEGGE